MAAEAGMSGAGAFDSMAAMGVFVLISTKRMAGEKLLPLYYTRDRIEKLFEIAKQGGNIVVPVS